MLVALYLSMKNLQTIYIPTSDNTKLMVGYLDKRDYYEHFDKTSNVKEVESVVFTQNEFNQFLEQYGKELLNSVDENPLSEILQKYQVI